MSGTLFLVATPIGNLEDITLRALRVLREADVIAAEDTRRTAKLLTHYAISTPTVSFHEHNSRTRLPQLLARLERGERVALVSDAGTPGISDPGVELVRRCAERGMAVNPLPGASAPVVAVVASGFPTNPLTVFGFPPNRPGALRTWLRQLSSIPHTVVFFEAPHRVRQTLRAAADELGVRPIMVARELTKVHQQLLRGTAADIFGRLTAPLGEFTIVVGPASVDPSAEIIVNDLDLMADFDRSAGTGQLRRRQVVARLARKYGRSTNEIYAALERAKNSGI